MKQGKGLIIAFFVTLAALFGCDTIDCTLDNTVVMRCSFFKDGNAVQLHDLLTITANDTNIVLLNSQRDASYIKLSLSYFNTEDTLVFHVTGDRYELTDTLWIKKTSYNHFESPDCPVNMFHHITAVRSTHMYIDSVTITQPDVNFAEHENLQIHFYSSAD